MKVGAPKRCGLGPLSSNRESPHFSPDPSGLSLLCVCWASLCSICQAGIRGAAHRTLGTTEVLWLTPFVGICGHFFRLCPTQGLDLPPTLRIWVFSGVFWWLGNTSSWISHEKFLLQASGNWIFISISFSYFEFGSVQLTWLLSSFRSHF